ncbi:hypothetical protein M1328_01515 [Patescibacteria group bacterium]|nr:hypothetical protein [Patescibacteria group bacterium]
MLLIWFIAIFVFSLVLAIHSMHDFGIPKEIKYLLDSKRIKGTIVFFNKGRSEHYRSNKRS